MKRRGTAWAAALLCLLLTAQMALLSGCRFSPVLEQIIYTAAEEPPPDPDAPENDNDEDHADKDEDLTSRDEDEESDTERDREETDPTQGEDENDESAPDTEQEDDSVNEGAAQGAGEGQGEQPQETEEMGSTQVPDVDPTGGEALRQVVDAYGQLVSVPEDVDTVAAVGGAAAMVEMLGGGGRLTAAPADFVENEFSALAFPDVAGGSVAALWSGDGSAGMGEESFRRLLELKPDVCFTLSEGFAFSDGQLAALAEAGIYPVTLPKLNNPGNIKTAVTLIGQVLGDRSAQGGTNAPAIAEDYCRWYDETIDLVDGRVDRFNYNDVDYSQDRYALRTDSYIDSETDAGYYTLYLSDWDAGAGYQVYSDSYVTLSGTGVAIAPSGYSTTPFSYYLSEAGVVNTAAAAADQFRLRHWYVDPLQSSTRIIEIAGTAGTVTDQVLTAIDEMGEEENTVTGQPTTVVTGTVSLGEERFPAVIVEDSGIKAALEADAAGRKLWTNYGPVASADGKVSGYGFSDEIGQVVSTTIRGDYEIYVVPAGVDSWSSGGAESVMVAMWAAAVYYGAFTQDELVDRVQEFYGQFYGCELSRDQALDILDGR